MTEEKNKPNKVYNELENAPVNPRKSRLVLNQTSVDQIKRMHETGQSPRDISNVVGASLDSIYKAIARIEEGVEIYEEGYKKAGRPKKDFGGVKDRILPMVSEDNSLTQVGIRKRLEEEGILISFSRVSTLMKECNLHRKRLKKRCDRVIQDDYEVQLRRFALEMTRNRSKNILFLDESGFNLHTFINYGYAPPTISPVKHQPASPGQNLSLCCMISITGIVSSMMIDGGYDARTYCTFLEMARQAVPENSLIVLDNTSIHRSNVAKDKYAELGYEVLFLPPYSPDFNPIENFFNSIKCRLNNIRPMATERVGFRVNVGDVINSYDQETQMFDNLYRKMWERINDVLSNNQ